MLRGGPKKKRPKDPKYPVTSVVENPSKERAKVLVNASWMPGNILAILLNAKQRLREAHLHKEAVELDQRMSRHAFMSPKKALGIISEYCIIKE